MVGARFVLFSAVLLLVGTVLFRRAIAEPRASEAQTHQLRRLEYLALAGAAMGLICWLPLEAAAIGSGWTSSYDSTVLSGLLFGTSLGQVWMVQVLFVLAQAVLTIRDRKIGPKGAIAGPLLLVLALGPNGHGSLSDDAVLPVLLGLHLAAAGAWVGSLPALWLCVLSAKPTEDLTGLSRTVARFSYFAQGAVVIAIATGLICLRLISGTWPTDLSSLYRRLLLAKVALVAVMIALALFNRFIVTPKLVSEPDTGLAMLKRTLALDLALSAAVLMLVAEVGTQSPMD